MKLFTGWVLAAGLVCAGSAADAQMLSPYSRASDFGGPYSEAPYGRPYSEAPYRGGPYYAAPPQEVPAPPRYGYGYGAAPALLPPHEIYNIIREAGFSPLGIPQQRGYVYTIAVIDRGGEDGRLVIDGRSGRIIRFMPAWQMGGHFNDTLNMTNGPAGVPPQATQAPQTTQAPQATQVRGTPRPPGSVPRVASRTVPVPKASPLARPAVAEPASAKAAEVPQQSAAVQTKPAEASPPPAATATIGQAKPSAQAILPTQEMPKAQGLD
jgi:hypothetical protein